MRSFALPNLSRAEQSLARRLLSSQMEWIRKAGRLREKHWKRRWRSAQVSTQWICLQVMAGRQGTNKLPCCSRTSLRRAADVLSQRLADQRYAMLLRVSRRNWVINTQSLFARRIKPKTGAGAHLM